MKVIFGYMNCFSYWFFNFLLKFEIKIIIGLFDLIYCFYLCNMEGIYGGNYLFKIVSFFGDCVMIGL